MSLKEFIEQAIIDIKSSKILLPTTVHFDIGIFTSEGYLEVSSSSTNRIKFSIEIQ